MMYPRILFGLLIFVGILLGVQLSWAQPAGSISGKVTDSVTGESLPGAIVLIKGTSIGASTNLQGDYSIANVPAGMDTVRVSYVGYDPRLIPITVTGGPTVTLDVKLTAVGVRTKGVTVTAQASGQNAAINEQLSSNKVVNVVSAARIQELPDANAAESVGRLPGIYLIRQGGEGSQIAIRGLQPKYNEVTIDGVEMASTGSPTTLNNGPTSSGDRSVDLSMISSNMLSGIEVYKTVTPDMDAAAIGGVVNFQIREAHGTSSGIPEVDLSTQGGYNNLQSAYNDYKFAGSIGKRFLNDRLGILAQGVLERVNLTADGLGGSYYMPTPTFISPVYLSSLNLKFVPSVRDRYDGALTIDYRMPHGKIDLMTFLSRGNTKTETYSQDYDIYTGNSITFGVAYSPNTLNTVINLLDFKQNTPLFDMDLRLSHSYSENIYPGSWSMSFSQGQAGINNIPPNLNPVLIGQAAAAKVNPDTLLFNGFNTSNSFSKQRNITGSIDLTRDITASDLVTGTLKLGGMYRYTLRAYTYADGTGSLYYPGNSDARAYIVQSMSWMAMPPYNMALNGTTPFPLTLFQDPNFSYGNFLDGNYAMGPGTNAGLIGQVIDTVVSFMRNKPGGVAADFSPDVYGSDANNYHGNEYESAAYAMVTINIGPQLTLIPGVRYQGLKTAYEASYYPNASAGIYYPNSWPHTDSTVSKYHGYWLPDMIVRYQPFQWLSVRAAYTNTLSYPDFSSIVPRVDIFASSVTWNNQAINPSRSQNYDLAFSFYDNTIGLLTVDGFLKQIDDMIFSQGGIYITNPAAYGLPSDTKGSQLSTDINDPFRVNVWGTELDWQTNFWYLPGLLSSLVLNVNYTHIFSGAKYPYILTVTYTGYPPKPPQHIDTSYSDRLIDQPNNIVNFSLGYDYEGFSAVVSMIYQADVFSGTNFWPQLRKTKSKYLRWDFTAKQNLPWFGLQLYLGLNDINSESDVTVIRGSGFPTSESDYGMTAALGLRWSLE